MLDDKTLAELDEAEKKATPVPWKVGRSDIESYDGNRRFKNCYTPNEEDRIAAYTEFSHEDAKFIALSRNHMRALIDEVKKWRGFATTLEEEEAFYTERRLENEKLRAELAAARMR